MSCEQLSTALSLLSTDEQFYIGTKTFFSHYIRRLPAITFGFIQVFLVAEIFMRD